MLGLTNPEVLTEIPHTLRKYSNDAVCVPSLEKRRLLRKKRKKLHS